MQQLTSFVFETCEVRITDHNGELWFVLHELLDSIKSKTTTTAAVESIKQGLGDGFVVDIPILDALGREQNTVIVAEPAATYLLSRSNTKKGRELNRLIHVEVLPQIRKTGTYRPKSFIEDVVEGMKRNEVKLMGFDQMSLNTRKEMRALQWEIQGVLGLRPKSQMYRRIKMREPLNLLINGMSSGEFRRRIGLQQQHRDVDNRPMKTADFLPLANQYALFRTDLLLSEFLRTNEFQVEYAEACEWYLRYGEIAKGEAERKYQVDLHNIVHESLLRILGFVEEQVRGDVSPYGVTELQISQFQNSVVVI